MRPIVIVLIVVALGAAVFTAFLATRFLASVQQQQAPAQVAQDAVIAGVEEVLVSARDVNPGEVLGDTDFRWEKWPKGAIDARFVIKSAAGEDPLAGFRDTMARRAIMAGEPMTQAAIVKRGDAGVTSAVLAPGMRTVTIDVSPRSGAAGLILPNDHVDVFMISNIRDFARVADDVGRDLLSQVAVEAIMRDIKVIAVNQSLARPEGAGPGMNAQTVTMEVTSEQAQKILVATQLGQIVLALRSWARNDEAAEADAKAPLFVTDRNTSKVLDDLMRGGLDDELFQMPEEGAEPVASSKTVAQTIRINRGGAVTVETLGQ
ncbi:Flp pilus assembly protein CpaB [Dongia sp.]|uniref:Flp pilus assembly protein CpaB n=1 Tax=Dongia sp. TaxID=1977262 RepID=UPI0035B21E1F